MSKHGLSFSAWIAISIALNLSSVALAVTMRHDRSAADYLSVGDFFTNVGRVDGVGLNSTGQLFSYIASGTLIAPNWVLTAAHVVDVAQSIDFTIGGRTIPAEQWVPHPNWTGNLTAGYDVGLFKLPVDVADIAPAMIYTGTSELGRIGTFVGYGKTGTGLTGATTFDGRRRGAQNNLDRFYNSTNRIFLTDFDNPSPYAYFDNFVGSRTPLYLEGLIAPGDSGGPVFMTEGAGRVVVGVNSFVGASIFDGKADSDYGDFAGATRVSAFSTWIDSVISGEYVGGALALSGSSPSNLRAAIATVPEPSVALSIMGAALMGLCRRARRGAQSSSSASAQE